jgi:hypothetical protein
MIEPDDIVPDGYRYALLMATIFKRVLGNDPMSTGERLQMLEALNGMTDARFTTEALAILAPADDATMAIVREAWKLDGDNATLSPSFDVLTNEEVFNNLVKANPSIAEAIRLCQRRDQPPAPPEAAQQQVPSMDPNATHIHPRFEHVAAPLVAKGVDFDVFAGGPISE